MNTGKLTPRSNDCVRAMRLSGGFGQPDGFASVLDVKVNKAGEACFHLTYLIDYKEHAWGVMLTSTQRKALAGMLLAYEPQVFEHYAVTP